MTQKSVHVIADAVGLRTTSGHIWVAELDSLGRYLPKLGKDGLLNEVPNKFTPSTQLRSN
jgi:hypothetical protein